MLNTAALSHTLQQQHFCHSRELAAHLAFSPAHIANFRSYWQRLVLDQNYKNYTHRERRILRYVYHPGQALQLNRDANFVPPAVYDVQYTQGVNRLSYAEESFLSDPVMAAVLQADLAIFQTLLEPGKSYAVDIDLFRVKADSGNISPTTSGLHQDGLDWIAMHFIGAENVQAVHSSLHTAKEGGTALLEHPLQEFLETLWVNDRALYHAAGPVQQLDPAMPAYRDLLLVSLMALPAT
jgi:hypothetical protein